MKRSAVLALVFGVSLLAEPRLVDARGSAAETRIAQGLSTAQQARRAGKFSKAFKVLEALAGRYPDDARPQHELGVLYAIHGQLDVAAARLSNAVRLDPLLIEARHGLAEVLRAAGRCADALPHYQRLVERPDFRETALRGVALCREITGDHKGAQAALQLIIRDYKDSAVGVWAKGYLPTLKETGGITPASAEREGLRHFKMRAYGAAAAWFELACGKAPTADRCFRLATARVGANDLLGAAIALRAALRANPKHLPSLSAWPQVARSLRAAGAGGLNVKMTDESSETMVRRVAKAILADDLLLAEQLASAAIKAGRKGRVLHWLRAETRVRAGHFTWASKDLDALSKGAAGAPHQARDLRAAIAIHLQQWDAARGMLKLAAPPAAPEGRRLPDAVDVHTDLKSFLRWRRSASDHQIRRLLDAGMRPYPAFEAPVFFNPESVKRWPRIRRGTGSSSRFSGKRRRRR